MNIMNNMLPVIGPGFAHKTTKYNMLGIFHSLLVNAEPEICQSLTNGTALLYLH